jgi:peptidoglycan hydrolase-like protein with peptidoglycan-binding domain
VLAAAALLAAVALLAAPALADAAPTRTLRLGSTGSDVAALNVRLAALGYLPAGSAGSTYTDATRHAVLAAQKWHGLGRDGVAGPRTLGALASAARPVPRRPGGAGARIEVLLDRQLALLIRDGRVQRTIAVSTGAPGYATPAGSFRITRKETRSWSYPYQVWLPYASYFNRGIALHGHASVPPYAASHGCVRVPEAFMREVYAFAAMGTAVRVL